MTARLRITLDGQSREHELAGERMTIGRAPECEIEVHAPGVSRRHAELERRGSQWTIRDLQSANGTFVNGGRVEQAELAPGDEIRIGEGARLELLADAPEARPAPAAREGREESGDVLATRAGRREPPGPPAAAAAEPAAPAAGTPAGGGRLWRLTSAADPARRVALHSAITTVGRDPGAGLFVDDGSVSRMHARLDIGPQGLRVTDLKSGNGTFVNDVPAHSRFVASGDRIRFGDAEYRVEAVRGVAWKSLVRPGAFVAAGLALAALAVWGVGAISRHEDTDRLTNRFRAEAVQSLQAAIDAARRREGDLARAHATHAADVLLLFDLVPKGASLEDPARLFADLEPRLPAAYRGFDFRGLFDSTAVRQSTEQLTALDDRSYVEQQLKRYCVELGQDANLPNEFVDQVWAFVREYQQYPAGMREMLARARRLQPRLVGILKQFDLPASVAYVAWVESNLDSTRVSSAHAVGLWQLMADPAREHGLHVNPSNPMVGDDRTNVTRSTRGAAAYLRELLLDNGPEYFMLVLASYNRGHNAIRSAKQKVRDPMLNSTRKYWYLVENKLIPEETRRYVPHIMAVRIIAEAPARFGFR